MKKLVIILATGLIFLLAAGCSQASNQPALTAPAASRGQNANPATTTAVPRPPTITQAASGGAGSSDTYLADSSPSDRMVVRTGNVELVVSDVSASLDNIAKIAADFGGYVVASQKFKDGERTLGTISIRVLAENYDRTITALRLLALDVINETSSSQDVTQEYTDLGSKVKNLEATEAQLLKIMQTAQKTEDILSIQRELTNVRGQIEQAKGRMLFLERTSSTSLIQIKLNETLLDLKFSATRIRVDTGESIIFTAEIKGGFAPYNYQWDFGDGVTSNEKSPSHSYKDTGVYSVSLKVTDDKGYTNTSVRTEYISVTGSWSPINIVRNAWDGFTAFGRIVVDVVIWLGIFSPVWIVIGAIVWWINYRMNKRRNNKPS